MASPSNSSVTKFSSLEPSLTMHMLTTTSPAAKSSSSSMVAQPPSPSFSSLHQTSSMKQFSANLPSSTLELSSAMVDESPSTPSVNQTFLIEQRLRSLMEQRLTTSTPTPSVPQLPSTKQPATMATRTSSTRSIDPLASLAKFKVSSTTSVNRSLDFAVRSPSTLGHKSMVTEKPMAMPPTASSTPSIAESQLAKKSLTMSTTAAPSIPPVVPLPPLMNPLRTAAPSLPSDDGSLNFAVRSPFTPGHKSMVTEVPMTMPAASSTPSVAKSQTTKKSLNLSTIAAPSIPPVDLSPPFQNPLELAARSHPSIAQALPSKEPSKKVAPAISATSSLVQPLRIGFPMVKGVVPHWCDGCDIVSCSGYYYRCLQCNNFDLCSRCIGRGKHCKDESHSWVEYLIDEAGHSVSKGRQTIACRVLEAQKWFPDFVPNPYDNVDPMILYDDEHRFICQKDPRRILFYIGGACVNEEMRNAQAGYCFIFRPSAYTQTGELTHGGTVFGRLETKGPTGIACPATNSRAVLRSAVAALQYRNWATDCNEGWRSVVLATSSDDFFHRATHMLKRWEYIEWIHVDRMTKEVSDSRDKDLWKLLLVEARRLKGQGVDVLFQKISADANERADEVARKGAEKEEVPSFLVQRYKGPKSSTKVYFKTVAE